MLAAADAGFTNMQRDWIEYQEWLGLHKLRVRAETSRLVLQAGGKSKWHMPACTCFQSCDVAGTATVAAMQIQNMNVMGTHPNPSPHKQLHHGVTLPRMDVLGMI